MISISKNRVLQRILCKIRGETEKNYWDDEKSAIFVHVPKTGGNSVLRALGMNATPHLSAQDFQRLDPVKFDQYFKFAFVRNPFDRLVSSYFYLLAGGINESDRLFASTYLKKYKDFTQFVTDGLAVTPAIFGQVHFRPQCSFLNDPNGKNMVDFVGRFEKIELEFEYIRHQLGALSALPHKNKSIHLGFRSYYTTDLIDIVGNIYSTDLRMLNYSFE